MTLLDDTELAVAGALVFRPERTCEPFFLFCRPEDCGRDDMRLVADAMMGLWHRRKGELVYCPGYLDPLADALGGIDGWGFLERLSDAMELPGGEAALCQHLAANGAVRRTRDVLGRWYTRLSDEYRVWRHSEAGVTVTPRSFKDAPDARRHLAGLLREIRRELRGTVGQPEAAKRERLTQGW